MAHDEQMGDGSSPEKGVVPAPGPENPELGEEEADGDARLLYRERHVAGWPWHVTGAVCIALSLTPLTTGVVWYFPFPLFLSIIGWAGSTVLRISVSGRAIGVHYGLLGVTIRPASVRSASVVRHEWGRRGFGIGIGPGRRRSYDFVGGSDEAVELRYVDEERDERIVVFSSADANAVVRAIEQARR